MQGTRLQKVQSRVGTYLSTALLGPWRRRCVGLISLLFGYFLGSNITVYFLEKFGQRPLVVLIMVIIIEVLIRLRSRIKRSPWPLYMLTLDNVRIGTVYSVVLEAFKLGS